MKKGFTLFEIIIGVAIIGVIAAVVAYPLSNFRRAQALRGGVEDLAAFIQESRSLTLSSRDSLQYGVHLETDRAVLFSGASYNAAAASNRTMYYPAGITASWSLAGSGANVIFNRLTGETDHYGTITLSLSSPTVTKTITISKLGSVDSN